MRLASLAMYVDPPQLAIATEEFWGVIRGRLVEEGMTDIRPALDKTLHHNAAWLEPDMLLSQTCGLPYVKQMRGAVRLVATPVYDDPGCDGPTTVSFIIVRVDAPVGRLEELKGSRAAINEPGSNSGANLFRSAIAPFAGGGAFFSSVTETGSHSASIAAVAEGRADVAAIDCVTFGNIRRFDPDRLNNIRVIAETERGPGLPFVTGPRTTDEELATLRKILGEVADAPSLADVRDALSLRRFDILTDADYDRLAAIEEQAAALGYPAIA
jgi:ABC-type phosphate/phosphonate transport system substrate-binding protein